MSERIKELKQQAGIDDNPDQEGLDLFAELIVRECSNFLKDTLDDHFAAEQLEEHFGVEE